MTCDLARRTRPLLLFAGLFFLLFVGITRGEDLKDALAQATAARGPEQGARVTILVNDEDCNPLPGSVIDISTASAVGSKARTTVGEEGTVKFNIAPGIFKVRVFHAGFAPSETVLIVPASGAEAELTLRCARDE